MLNPPCVLAGGRWHNLSILHKTVVQILHLGIADEVLGGSGWLWAALRGSGRLWAALAGSGVLWAALCGFVRCWAVLGGSGRPCAALGRSGLFKIDFGLRGMSFIQANGLCKGSAAVIYCK